MRHRVLSRVSVTLAVAVAAAMLIARTLLPVAVRLLAKHASAELYQLTVIAFCLIAGWIFGHLVRACLPQLPEMHTCQQTTLIMTSPQWIMIISDGVVAEPQSVVAWMRAPPVQLTAFTARLLCCLLSTWHWLPRHWKP